MAGRVQEDKGCREKTKGEKKRRTLDVAKAKKKQEEEKEYNSANIVH